MKIKNLVIFGTRPEAIKMAPLVKELQKQDKFDTKVCVTAQHRQMLDQVLSLFKITPDFDLNLMSPRQDLSSITSNVLYGMNGVFQQWTPDIVLVHGDTTTTFASSLAAYYHKIKVGHIEAGLRTGNKFSPWPEEINRKITGLLSDFHFSPTKSAKLNLIKEGVDKKTIKVTGNTVIDALLNVKSMLDDNFSLKKQFHEKFNFLNTNHRLILVTGHRRENFGEGFENICHALNMIALRDDVEIVYPVQLNPTVQEPVKRILAKNHRIHLIEPQDYLPFVYLMDKAHIIITDSGGIQEEAPSLGKPVLVMRDVTERPEAVKAGTVKLVGTNSEQIINNTFSLLDDNNNYKKMAQLTNPYGDGKAAKRIVKILTNIL